MGFKKLSNEEVDRRLEYLKLDIIRIGDYINCDINIDWQCKKCFHIWKSSPYHIVGSGSGKNKLNGCRKCSNRLLITNDIVDSRLIGRDIKRIGSCTSSTDKIDWLCLINECNYIWKASPNHVLNSFSGCPLCKNKSEKFIFKEFKKADIIFEYQKNIKNIDPEEINTVYFDFFIPTINTIIEYNGEQHYRVVRFGGMDEIKAIENFRKQKIRDAYVKNFLNDRSINLIEIDGRFFRKGKLQSAIIDVLIPYIKEKQVNEVGNSRICVKSTKH